MKDGQLKLLLLGGFLLFLNLTLAAQSHSGEHQHHNEGFNLVLWFGILELPFLLVCIYYSFKTAAALKGGVLGSGMNYLAWGFLVMAVGHMAMQVHHIWGFDIFRDVFGYTVGNIFWFTALITTWGLSAFGFYKIYRTSKKG